MPLFTLPEAEIFFRFFGAVGAGKEDGFWLPHTSSFDFCERNYEYSIYIAELWNSLTSIWIMLTGWLGYRYIVRVRPGALTGVWVETGKGAAGLTKAERAALLEGCQRTCDEAVPQMGLPEGGADEGGRTVGTGTDRVAAEEVVSEDVRVVASSESAKCQSPRARTARGRSPSHTKGRAKGKAGKFGSPAKNTCGVSPARMVRKKAARDSGDLDSLRLARSRQLLVAVDPFKRSSESSVPDAVALASRLFSTHFYPRYAVSWCFFLLVGSGSALFHGTLKRSAQALDELPMCIFNMIGFYCLIVNRKVSWWTLNPFSARAREVRAMRWEATRTLVDHAGADPTGGEKIPPDPRGSAPVSWDLARVSVGNELEDLAQSDLTAVVFTGIGLAKVALYVLYEQYELFLGIYGLGVLGLGAFSSHLGWRSGGWAREQNRRVHNRLFVHGILGYGLGFGFWSLENAFCSELRSFHLHVFWHALAPLGTLLYLCSFLVSQVDSLGGFAAYEWRWGRLCGVVPFMFPLVAVEM